VSEEGALVDRIGTEIAGYRIESLIARGGMGEVYLATQSFPERKVALKLLPHDLANDQAFRERFIRESNAAASVEHPNIVPVYGAGDADGELYIAMRYVEGEDLRSLLDREGPLALERAVRICAQIDDALEEAHEHGLVHRDVKPGNILISKGDRAYLTDFGLIRRSKLETDLTKTGQFMGTVDYVAPEQIKGQEVDGRADIYSLGCVLYECLTGQRPFRRESDVATLYAHLEDAPPKPSAKNPLVPSALDEVVAKAMAKRPDARYATAGELAADLGAMFHQPRGGEAAKTRGLRGKVVLVAVIAVVAAAAAVVAATRTQRPPEDTKAAQGNVGPPINSAVEVDPDTGKILATAPDIGTGGDRQARVVTGEGSVWVLAQRSGGGSTGAGCRNLYEIDPETLVASQSVPACSPPPATLGIGFRTVWFALAESCVDPSLPCGIGRFDPSTGRRLDSVSFGSGVYGSALSIGKKAVWVGLSDGSLDELDGPTGRIERQVALGVNSVDAVVAAANAVWIADKLDGVLLKVDPANPKDVKRIDISGNIDVLAADDSGAWILDRTAGTVTPVDPSTNTTGQPIRVGENPSDMAVGLGSVWVTDQTEGSVYRIDAGLGVVDRYELGAPLAAIAVDQRVGVLWVIVASTPSGG
jgi:predicted Ser/Thr protein kinase